MRGPRTFGATTLSLALPGPVLAGFAPASPVHAAPTTTTPTPTAPVSGSPDTSPTPTASPTGAGPGEKSKPEVQFTRRATKVVLGRSVQGRSIVAHRKGTPGAKHRVVLLGQIHGNERAGVTTAKKARHLRVRSDTEVWVVPTMNPDGHAAHTRTNARGVDLNRNWPMNWRRTARGITWSGPRATSEPETRVLLKFLKKVKPTYVVSLHQPFGEVGFTDDKPKAFQRRLARELRLPLADIGIGGPVPKPMSRAKEKARGLQPGGGNNLPTLTGWYNARYSGTAITVEFVRKPKTHFVEHVAPRAILKSTRAR